jgi:hypothetical protein
MNIPQKKVLVKVNLASIVHHDDAPESEVTSAIEELKKFMDTEWAVAKDRRKAKAAAKALPR